MTFLVLQEHRTVGIVTGYGLDDRGVIVQVLVESRISSSHIIQAFTGVG
jgi:hypothetical protein